MLGFDFVLKKYAGFDAYLVGGCVRDLLLKKTPKDFDVITTANLNQVCMLLGCFRNMQGSNFFTPPSSDYPINLF